MSKENIPLYHNNWIDNALPNIDCPAINDTNIPLSSSETRHCVLVEMTPEEKVKKILSSIQNEKGSLYDIIEENKEDVALTDSNMFEYRRGKVEYKCNVKIIKMQFNKAPCKVLLLNDHTAFYNLAKLEGKYQKIYIASIVHDVRTPIQGVMGVLEMLRNTNSSEEDKKLIKVGIETCKLLIFLTHDITDLAQIEGNVIQIKKDEFEVDSVIDECVQLLSFGYNNKGIKLIKNVFGVHIRIVSDKHRYMQILLNLLGNALKFTVSGSVTVTVSLDSDSDLLATKVTDTGVGIRSEDLNKLFTLFGKIDSSSSLNPQGVGLGLTICKKLSRAMDGDISVESTYGSGSTFTFTIKANNKKCIEGNELMLKIQKDNHIPAKYLSTDLSAVRNNDNTLIESDRS